MNFILSESITRISDGVTIAFQCNLLEILQNRMAEKSTKIVTVSCGCPY